VWFRRALFVIFAPDMRQIMPLSGRKSTQRPAQFYEASSIERPLSPRERRPARWRWKKYARVLLHYAQSPSFLPPFGSSLWSSPICYMRFPNAPGNYFRICFVRKARSRAPLPTFAWPEAVAKPVGWPPSMWTCRRISPRVTVRCPSSGNGRSCHVQRPRPSAPR
jgi:hypothetical protein